MFDKKKKKKRRKIENEDISMLNFFDGENTISENIVNKILGMLFSLMEVITETSTNIKREIF